MVGEPGDFAAFQALVGTVGIDTVTLVNRGNQYNFDKDRYEYIEGLGESGTVLKGTFLKPKKKIQIFQGFLRFPRIFYDFLGFFMDY